MKNKSIKFQIRNRMLGAANKPPLHPSLIRDLVLKDFQRLEKLINLDLPQIKLDFDYSQLDELTQTLFIEVEPAHCDVITSYLNSNFYQVMPIGKLLDPLMCINALSHLMMPGKTLVHNGENLIFDSFALKYRGYLDESPGRPGLHQDFETMICRKVNDEILHIKTRDFSFIDNPSIEAEMLEMETEWKWGMPEDHSFIGSLPPTNYYEGDVVKIIDPSHPNFCKEDEASDQCLVFRTRWDKDPLIHQIKLPTKEMGEATADQLVLQAKGVTRLFYNGTPPGQWKDLKSEAEFYLLLGLFMYHYNPETDSYSWTMPQAKAAIKRGDGHGLLRWKGSYFLISYLLEDSSTFKPDDLADATLATDLVLSL